MSEIRILYSKYFATKASIISNDVRSGGWLGDSKDIRGEHNTLCLASVLLVLQSHPESE